MRRFFVESPIEGEQAQLADSEAHHLLHVLRATEGTEVVLFDGTGAEFNAVVSKLGRSTVDLQITDRQEVDRESSRRIELFVALPKGDRQKWLVEKCVELGVAKLTPLSTSRSVAQPTGKALERLRRGVIEASKQCGRNHLMQIGEATSLSELTSEPAEDGDVTKLIAHPEAGALRSHDIPTEAAIAAAIGPEGGFDNDEIAAAAKAKWQPIGLGPRILRIETAALMLASLFSDAGRQ